MKSLLRFGALFAAFGLVFTGCGGGSGTGGPPPVTSTPTPPPIPASTQAELCPATGAAPASFERGFASAQVSRRLPARSTSDGTAPDLLAVSYSRSTSTQSIAQQTSSSATERAAGAHFVRSLSGADGGVTRVVRTDPANLQNAMTALRKDPGVKSVALVHYRRALSANSLPVNDPYYNGFSASGPPGPAPYYETAHAVAPALGGHGQWNMHVIQVGRAWGYSQANSTGRTYPGAIHGAPIAIIDTGFDLTHPELAGAKVIHTQCYVTFGGYSSQSAFVTDFDGHGTDVAGYASGDTNNGIGFASVGYNTPLMLYRVFPTPPNDPPNDCNSKKYQSDPRCSLTSVDEAAAINDAVAQGAKVISLSIGATGPNCTDSTELNAIEGAISKGAVIVAAAGNGDASGNGLPSLSCPAAYAGVIAVGASALDDSTSTVFERVAHYSNYDAAHPTTWGVVAPGGDPDAAQTSTCTTADCIDWLQWVYGIYSKDAFNPGACAADYPALTGPADCRTLIAGTSMSTPHVAGAVALMLGVSPGLTPAEVKNILCSTADDISDGKQGCGRLNVYHALAKTIGDANP